MIVTADDFGLSECVNRGVIEAVDCGLVTTVSVMACGRAFEHAAGLAAERPDLDCGVHFVLDEEAPVLQPERIPSLVDESGRFFSRSGLLWRLLVTRTVDPVEIEAELSAQVTRCLDRGIRLTHVSGHGHAHVYPRVTRAVVAVAREYGIPSYRLPSESALLLGLDFRPRQYLKKLVVGCFALNAARMFRRAGIVAPDRFLGQVYSGRLSSCTLTDLIERISSAGVVELMTHPGRFDAEEMEPYQNWNFAWEQELEALKILERGFGKRGHLRRMTYRELATVSRAHGSEGDRSRIAGQGEGPEPAAMSPRQSQLSVAVCGPEDLDFEEYAGLQREGFSEILEPREMGDQLTPAYFRWKYSPPGGDARIATLRETGQLVAAASLVPMTPARPEGPDARWQMCDATTSPQFRRRGHLMRCLRALDAERGDSAIGYAYPNETSMTAFLKLGWAQCTEMRAYVRPRIGRKRALFSEIERTEGDLTDCDELLAELAAAGRPMIDRTAPTLRWRYLEHPASDYEVFVMRDTAGGMRGGLLVMRDAPFAGRRVGVIMELLTGDASVARRLLAFAAAWSREHRLFCTIHFSAALSRARAARSGYLPVPGPFSPKRMILVTSRDVAAPQPEGAWRPQLGDWDGL